MVWWLRWHCPPDTGFDIRALAVWGRARYLSVTEAPHNTDFLINNCLSLGNHQITRVLCGERDVKGRKGETILVCDIYNGIVCFLQQVLVVSPWTIQGCDPSPKHVLALPAVGGGLSSSLLYGMKERVSTCLSNLVSSIPCDKEKCSAQKLSRTSYL